MVTLQHMFEAIACLAGDSMQAPQSSTCNGVVSASVALYNRSNGFWCVCPALTYLWGLVSSMQSTKALSMHSHSVSIRHAGGLCQRRRCSCALGQRAADSACCAEAGRSGLQGPAGGAAGSSGGRSACGQRRQCLMFSVCWRSAVVVCGPCALDCHQMECMLWKPHRIY